VSDRRFIDDLPRGDGVSPPDHRQIDDLPIVNVDLSTITRVG
jgi:hypothetical protein